MFDYISLPATGGINTSIFYDWRRFDPNNHTVSHGVVSPGGERCVTIYPGQEDALLLEQGSMLDDSCIYARPFICQYIYHNKQYSITVTGGVVLNGGSLKGGMMILIGSTLGIINQFNLYKRAIIDVHLNSSTYLDVRYLGLKDSSKLYLHSTLQLYDQSFIGESISRANSSSSNSPTSTYSSNTVAQSVILADTISAIQLTCTTTCSAEINARVETQGRITIPNNGNLFLHQVSVFSLPYILCQVVLFKIYIIL
jgi:hypothetical protein